MNDAEFAELVRACTLASIARTESRSPAAAAHARRNIDDVTQAAALEALERIHAGADGDAAQIVSRAANAVIIAEYRRSLRRAAEDPQTEDGTPREPPARAHARPTEEAAEAADVIQCIAEAMPEAYRQDAPPILAAAAEGYNGAEIARRTGYHPRKVQRVIKAAREAAQREGRLTA